MAVLLKVPRVEEPAGVEESKTQIVVKYEVGPSGLHSVITCLLIGAASAYLVVMIVYICYKKRRQGFSSPHRDDLSSDDENFASVTQISTSSYYDSEMQTSASRSSLGQGCGDRKDTMSNSSLSHDFQ